MEVKRMNDEVYVFALKNTLNEIQNICPDIKNSFIFKEDGEIVAGDENTPEKTIVRLIDDFEGIFEKGDSINGIEAITLEGSMGKLVVSSVSDFYLVTVTTGKADMKYVNTVTRVLIPTVLKLVESFNPASLKKSPPAREIEPETSAFRTMEKEETEEKETEEPLIREPPKPFSTELKLGKTPPETPINQLIVENLGGLLVPSDTVRIDNETLTQWNELYEGRKIEEVEIQTFDGKLAQCKVKPIKESKYEGKGIVQMPEKVQLTLEIRKGELVRIKPIVE